MRSVTCPHLGIKEDAKTALDFPSEGNYCFKTLPPAPVKGDHQRHFCLAANHVNCPVYQFKKQRPIPPAIAAPAYNREMRQKLAARVGIPLLLALFIGTGMTWGVLGRESPLRSWFIPRSGGNALQNTAGAQQFNLLDSNSPDNTLLSNPTETPSPELLIANCAMPEGWTSYVVNPTDSLFRLSVVYGVGVSDLQKANCMGQNTVILPGQVIYIPFIPTSTPTTPPTRVPYVPPPTAVPQPVSNDEPETAPQEEEPEQPTEVPPTDIPPTDIPPTDVPPTEAPPPPEERPTVAPPDQADNGNHGKPKDDKKEKPPKDKDGTENPVIDTSQNNPPPSEGSDKKESDGKSKGQDKGKDGGNSGGKKKN